MAFTRRIFTKEFRLNAAKLVVDEHRPAVDVARELDINPKSLYSWVRQYRSGLLQASLDGEDSVSAEQAEIARLRSELQKSRAEVLLWDEGTKNGPDRSALLGHNFVYQETKPHGFYSSYLHQRISS